MAKLKMKHRIVLVIVHLLILTGCEQSLNIVTKSDVPTPLVTQLPLKMGVYYEEKFRNFIYQENSEDRPKWTIDSGASQVELFDQILPSMFENVRHVSAIADAQGDDLDAILAPNVEEMQFALPRETQTDLYEVWVKYKIQLHKPNGDLIAEWPLTGYGKSSTEFFKGRDEGLQTAINLAFRDAGAKMALYFAKIPEVKQWLANKPGFCSDNIANEC